MLLSKWWTRVGKEPPPTAIPVNRLCVRLSDTSEGSEPIQCIIVKMYNLNDMLLYCSMNAYKVLEKKISDIQSFHCVNNVCWQIKSFCLCDISRCLPTCVTNKPLQNSRPSWQVTFGDCVSEFSTLPSCSRRKNDASYKVKDCMVLMKLPCHARLVRPARSWPAYLQWKSSYHYGHWNLSMLGFIQKTIHTPNSSVVTDTSEYTVGTGVYV